MTEAAPMVCGSCGAENDPAADFCAGCGHFLEWDDDPPVAPRVAPAAPPAVVEPPAPESQPEQPIDRALASGKELAETEGRADLKEHLEAAQQRLHATPVPVVVCGEFKHGKSTLINALLLRPPLCPVDEDIVTAVPTMIKYADGVDPYIDTVTESDGEEVIRRQPYRPELLRALVTEDADPRQLARQRAVEIGLDHVMLRTGLCLVDTPGVGGLDSAHGILTLGALDKAKGVLFVTDASQELTAPEMAFLDLALSRCSRLALVVTKIDLFPAWREIVELDRGHLARAGYDLPIIPVSSAVRLAVPGTLRGVPAPDRQRVETALNTESGFDELVRFLAQDVVPPSRAEAARIAAHEVDFVAGQLQQKTQVEQAVLTSPREREQVVADLGATERRTRQLAAPNATWQLFLGDGIQDLVSDVEHDLQRRLRSVMSGAEQIIDEGDPEKTWPDVEAWLRRHVAMATVENRDLLVERTEELAASVAEQFDLQAGSPVSVRIAELDDRLDSVTLAPTSSLSLPGGKLAPVIAAARTGIYLPMLGGSIAATLFSGPFAIAAVAIAGVSVALGAGIGRKIIKDERARQRTFRQQQAKAAMRRFVDDVAFLLNKQTRDELRLTQRRLRDDFHARASLMHRSTVDSLEAVNRVADLDESQQRRHRDRLAVENRRLDHLRSTAREVAEPTN